jgi:predicted NBD/HSP70 family sugar kinase
MYALFDIGGTKTRVARSDGERLLDAESFRTPKSYDEGVAELAEGLKKILGTEQFEACAGGVRGVLLTDRSGIDYDHVLVDWQDRPLVADLATHLGVPVALENDAALAGLGEATHGAGKGYSIVAYHTVSTGVGGVRIDHGHIDAYHRGFEPGHQVIDVDRTLHQQGDRQDGAELEEYISGTAVKQRLGKEAYEVPQADPLWNELALILAHGLKNTVAYWSPEIIVLGGSMMLGDPRILLSDVERHLKRLLGERIEMPRLVLATLGDESGLYGAMTHLMNLKRKGVLGN